MPKIPTSLGERTPAVSRRGIVNISDQSVSGNIEAAGMRARGTQAIAKGLEDVAGAFDRIQDSRDQMQYNQAKSAFLTEKIQADAAFDNDPDWNTYVPRYSDRMTKAKGKLAEGISNPKYRAQFEYETAPALTEGTVGIRRKANDKELSIFGDNLKLTLDNNVDALLAAKDEPTRTALLKANEQAIQAGINRGAFSEPAAALLRKATVENYATRYYDMFDPIDRLAKGLIPGMTVSVANSPMYVVGQPQGMIAPGNIDLKTRPNVKNADGSISTVRSMSYQNEAGEEVLIPTVSDEGKIMSNDEAIRYWGEKNQFLAKFSRWQDAEAYAENLHNQQAQYYSSEKQPTSIQAIALMPPDVQNEIAKYGVNAPILARIAALESSGGTADPNIFQFKGKTAIHYGITADSTVAEQVAGANTLLEDNRKDLRSAIGREPSPAEIYLAHQQGVSGAAALLGDPKQPAIVALTTVYKNVDIARDAIVGNGGTEGMTAGQFTQLWTNKFNGGDNTAIGAIITGDLTKIPEGGFDFNVKTNTPADFLPPDVRTKMVVDVFKAVKDEQDKARAAIQTELALTIDDHITDAYNTGSVDPALKAKIMWANPNATGAKTVEALEDSAVLGNDTRAISKQDKATDEKMLFDAQTVANAIGPGSAAANKRLGQLREAVSQKWKAVEEDGPAWLVQNEPTIADAWEQVVADPSNTEAIRTAIMQTETAMKQLGTTSTRVFPKTVAADLVTKIVSDTNPKTQYKSFLDIVDLNNDALSRKAVADLMEVKNGLPAGADLAADIAIETGDTPRGQRVWDLLTTPIPEGIKLTQEQRLSGMAQLNEGLGGVLIAQAAAAGNVAGSAKLTIPLTNAIEQMAKAKMLDGKTTADDAVSASVEELTGHITTVNEPNFAQVYFSKKYPEDEMKEGLWRARATFADNLAASAAQNFTGADLMQWQSYAMEVKANAVWINEGDGYSLMLYGRPIAHEKSDEDVWKAGKVQLADRLYGQKEWVLPNTPKPDTSPVGPIEDPAYNYDEPGEKKTEELTYDMGMGPNYSGGLPTIFNNQTGTNELINRYDIEQAIASDIFYGKGYESSKGFNIYKEDFAALQRYASHNAIVALGFDPSVITLGEPGEGIAGAYEQRPFVDMNSPNKIDKITLRDVRTEQKRSTDPDDKNRETKIGFNPLVAAHESAHRGLETISQAFGGNLPFSSGGWAERDKFTDEEITSVEKLKSIQRNPFDKHNEGLTRIIEKKISGQSFSDFEVEQWGDTIHSYEFNQLAKSLETVAEKLVAQRRKSGPR